MNFDHSVFNSDNLMETINTIGEAIGEKANSNSHNI